MWGNNIQNRMSLLEQAIDLKNKELTPFGVKFEDRFDPDFPIFEIVRAGIDLTTAKIGDIVVTLD